MTKTLVALLLSFFPLAAFASSSPLTTAPMELEVPAPPRTETAPSASEGSEILESFEPSEGQPYRVWVIRYADSRVRNTFYTDLSDDGHRVEYIYDGLNRLSEVRHIDTSVAPSGAKTSSTRVEGFGFDPKMRYSRMWQTETGKRDLHFNYWYDSQDVSSRHYRVKEADGPETGAGREVLDDEGRVTGRLFKAADGSVTRSTFAYVTEKGRPYVRERIWKDGQPTSVPPDEIKFYQVVSGMRLLEIHTVQRFAPDDRKRITGRHSIHYSYNV